MPVSEELIQRLKDLKANIESFLKLHKNPYDSSCHNDLAAKLERVEAMLLKLTGEQSSDNSDQDTSTDMGGDTSGMGGDDTSTDTGGDTSGMGNETGGGSALDNLHQEVEQARAAARDALATVEDMNAPQVNIEDAEKAKVEAYVAKAKEFLDAYAAAEEADKAAFDQANSGYVAEIEQSHNWNANDFLPRANGETPVGSGDGSDGNAGTGQTITGSVGKNGTNNEADVRVVQELLNGKGASLDVDGKIGGQTIGAIESFQRSLGMSADGLVEPGRNTWKGLIGSGGSVSSGGSNGGNYSNTSGKLLFEDKAVSKHGQAFIDKVKEVCSRLGLEPDFLMATIDAECGFDHRAVNPVSGATGLIQFMPATAADLGTSTSAIRGMSAIQQLDYVEKYFKGFGSLVSQISEPAESYLIVFYPYAVGKPDSYVLGSQESPRMVALIARQNGIYDLNKDGQITKGEIMEYMRNNKYKGAYDRLQQGSDDTGDNTGGDNTGGDNTGGDNTGGDNTGGNTGNNTGSGQSISGSVGRGGTNNEADVRIVQELLNGKGGRLTVDGKIGNKTIGSIESFQKSLGMSSPDGLIEPGKNTWKGLIGSGGSVDPNHVATGGGSGAGSSFDPGEPLTPGTRPSSSNFSMQELCVSRTYPHLVQEPPKSMWSTMQKLMNNLEVIRAATGGALTINSGYRAPALNSAVGGVGNSQHLYARAADIVSSKMGSYQLYELILRLMDEGKITPGGVGRYSGFVHYDIRGTKAPFIKG